MYHLSQKIRIRVYSEKEKSLRENFAFFASICFAKKENTAPTPMVSRKHFCEMRTKMFAFIRETFCSVQTLIWILSTAKPSVYVLLNVN